MPLTSPERDAVRARSCNAFVPIPSRCESLFHQRFILRQRFSMILGVDPDSVGIRTFQGRWGSCSAKGKLEFNWKIIIAPTRIVDYVVIHELCHLVHHNHGPKFWKSVERPCPDFRERKEWLRVHGGRLDV